MKRLSFRFVRRLMLLLALVFPVVYLMGGFVAALAGSHGNVTLAQDDEVVTTSKIVDFNQIVQNGNFEDNSGWRVFNYPSSYSISDNVCTITSAGYSLLSIGRNLTIHKDHVYLFSVYARGVTDYTYIATRIPSHVNSNGVDLTGAWDRYVTYRTASADGTGFEILFGGTSTSISVQVKNVFMVDLTQMYGVGNEPTQADFLARYDADYYAYTLSTSLVEESRETPTYSEYLFNQILGSDNIIKQWGYYALSDEDKGFAPFASLIQIVDDNFFHLGDSNDLGLFVYGYVYYALNIVAIYELVALVVMVFTIPLKLTDRFTKEM